MNWEPMICPTWAMMTSRLVYAVDSLLLSRVVGLYCKTKAIVELFSSVGLCVCVFFFFRDALCAAGFFFGTLRRQQIFLIPVFLELQGRSRSWPKPGIDSGSGERPWCCPLAGVVVLLRFSC